MHRTLRGGTACKAGSLLLMRGRHQTASCAGRTSGGSTTSCHTHASWHCQHIHAHGRLLRTDMQHAALPLYRKCFEMTACVPGVRPGITDCFKRVAREQGIASFWRGNLANVLRQKSRSKPASTAMRSLRILCELNLSEASRPGMRSMQS